MKHLDATYLRHMIEAIENIQKFLEGMSYEQLVNDPKTMYAILSLFGILGEAANNLSTEFCASHPEIPVSDIISMRNRLIHKYFEIDLRVIWNVYENELDSLQSVLKKIPE